MKVWRRGFWLRFGMAVLLSLFGFAVGSALNPPAVRAGGPVMHLSLLRILSANLWVIGICLTGIVTAGITSVTTLLSTGIVYGMQARILAAKVGCWQLLSLTAPHGILEITSLWLAGAAGLAGLPLIRMANRGDRDSMIPMLKQSALNAGVAVLSTVVSCLIEWHRIETLGGR